ncbi:allantoate deiminase 2 isoform X1 [Phoenix dactylifera]|uniref:allantoate deiminase n=1 Tax=Phoenix dactylifera TaxID=42345 RepID=A0A8B8JC14_PHODC|nr:allantoate deiminase 2 isoform X1 [Phoenix dactylifera]
MGNTKSWSTFFPPTHDLFVAVHSGAGAMASLPPKLSPFSLVDDRKALIFSVSILLASLLISGLEVGSGEDGGDELFREILRDEAVSRINQLGKISDADGYLERTFLSPGSIRATDLIMSWMQDAGLKTWVDQMGNLHGRTNAINATAETLLIGSHLDTVVDAGKYDGSLGIVCAISALKVLKVKGKLEKLYRPVEVIAFSDEEGVRFQSTFLGSAAIAGILPPTTLQISDKSGITVQDVLRENSFDATDESLVWVKYEPRSVWGYVEVHIEQGPVLETLGYPLGVVKGIAGQTRLKVEVSGAQGHAGTVPMLMRQDPMAAAAELVVTVESLCKYPDKFLAYDEHCGFFGKESFAGLVCTVGEISCWPSASNVIPGQVNFTVDIRAIDDEARELVVSEFSNQVYRKCEERMVNCTIEHKHNAEAAHCDSGLSLQLKHATSSALGKMLGDIHSDVPILMSGAGHDAMAMSHLTKVGMLFVRCRGGISHSPEESVLDDDVWAAGLALLHFFDQHVNLLHF